MNCPTLISDEEYFKCDLKFTNGTNIMATIRYGVASESFNISGEIKKIFDKNLKFKILIKID